MVDVAMVDVLSMNSILVPSVQLVKAHPAVLALKE